MAEQPTMYSPPTQSDTTVHEAHGVAEEPVSAAACHVPVEQAAHDRSADTLQPTICCPAAHVMEAEHAAQGTTPPVPQEAPAVQAVPVALHVDE